MFHGYFVKHLYRFEPILGTIPLRETLLQTRPTAKPINPQLPENRTRQICVRDIQSRRINRDIQTICNT